MSSSHPPQRFCFSVGLGLVLLWPCLVFGAAVPDFPEGTAPKSFYGGFFPDEQWLASLRPLPRDERRNPQLAEVLEQPGSVDIDALEREVKPYLKVAPEDLLGLVPRRNRLAGNARVMPSLSRLPKHPLTGRPIVWTPDVPDELRDVQGKVFDPLALLPPTGVFQITGPKGDVQEYPYHDRPDGKRIYLLGEYMDAQRIARLASAVRALGILYHQTEDTAYAERAAAILVDFATAVPRWPKIARGRPYGFEGAKRFRPVDEITRYAGLWYDKYHSGLTNGPEDLARGYDLIVDAAVWDRLDRQADGQDARAVIERDLFLYTAIDALRYDIRYPQPASALSNYIPYQCRGLICIGAAIGLPELVHYATWKIEQMVEKTLMADSVFPEGPSYARQHIMNMHRAGLIGLGYTDPPSFTSRIDGRRFDGLDIVEALPALGRAADTLATMTYPDGKYMTVDDTLWGGRAKHSPHEVVRPVLFAAYSHAILGRGRRKCGNRFQAHLNFSGNWGHDHRDMLNLVLWPYGEDLVCDIGYVHTYRPYASNTLGHNTVVVDRQSQGRVNDPGRLTSWHPVEDGVQVVEASAPHVYGQSTVYRRKLVLIPLGGDNLVLDIFEVSGGRVHEWMAHGSGAMDQTLSVSLPTEPYGESYADNRQPFTPPAHNQYVKERLAKGLPPWELSPGESDPWYGVLRNVRRAVISAPFEATLTTAIDGCADVRLHVLQPTDGQIFTATAPACRRGAENDISLVEKIRMPKLIIRRDGKNLQSRFVVLWEPVRDQRLVQSVSRIDSKDGDSLALQINTRVAEAATIRVFHASDAKQSHQTRARQRWIGRTAITISGTQGQSAWLYDCAALAEDDLSVTIQQRSPLHVRSVTARDDGSFVIELSGVWSDMEDDTKRIFNPAIMATLTQDGDHHRPIPVTAVEREGANTVLHCARHPGFRYDWKTHTLSETFSPYRTIPGRAAISLPNRVILKRACHGPQTDWRITTATNPVTLNGVRP